MTGSSLPPLGLTIEGLKPGFYWLFNTRSGRWTVGKFDGSVELGWTFVGSLHLADGPELFEPDEDGEIAYKIGPMISPPDHGG